MQLSCSAISACSTSPSPGSFANGIPTNIEPLHQRPLLIYALAALLLGAQMMSIGFLAELVTAYMSREEDSYSIAEKTPPTNP